MSEVRSIDAEQAHAAPDGLVRKGSFSFDIRLVCEIISKVPSAQKIAALRKAGRKM